MHSQLGSSLVPLIHKYQLTNIDRTTFTQSEKEENRKSDFEHIRELLLYRFIESQQKRYSLENIEYIEYGNKNIYWN